MTRYLLRMKIRVAFVIGQYPPEERKLREQVALSYATPEIEIGILSTPASPYIRGMSPTDIQMAAPLFIEAFCEAERQDYDAVVPLGMLDLGIDGGKSAVNIPVVGPFEASFHVASLLGDRFGLIVYHPSPDFSRRGDSEGQQSEINENPDEPEHSAPCCSNS